MFSYLLRALHAVELYGKADKWDKQMATLGGTGCQKDAAQRCRVAVSAVPACVCGMRLEKDLAPLTVIPRGFGGSNMSDVVRHMDKVVLPYKPRAILLYQGDNDIVSGRVTTDMVVDVYEHFLKELWSELPKTRVYILSVKPSISRQNCYRKCMR